MCVNWCAHKQKFCALDAIQCNLNMCINLCMFTLTLYRARLSRHGLCLIILPEVETFALILLVVTAGAVDVVVDVAADAFTRPRFFNEPIEPFNKSGLSTSGPPNS